eukprot:jgi/Chrzof1/1446/Cz10g08080.t1
MHLSCCFFVTSVSVVTAALHVSDAVSKKREQAPRWYITNAELAALSSYMRGRLTLDKVNAAIDEVAMYADSNHRWMHAVRAHQVSRIPADDRKRAQEMFHSIEAKDSVKGRFWFLETDLKSGSNLKMDKTGKSVLMVLRHVGRLAEVCIPADHYDGNGWHSN